MSYKLQEACREPGCPVCRLEQQGVERHLDNQFYENVNSPAWRERLRASHAFCHEHAWLAVNKRLGDALGFSLIYHDIVNSILNQLDKSDVSAGSLGSQTPGKFTKPVRDLITNMLAALKPRKRCPVCEHREEVTRNILSALIEDLQEPQLAASLQASDGLCLPHLRLALGYVKDGSVYESLLALHRAKLESLRSELAEFIRKNDYQAIKEGFGREGDAWLRAIGFVSGSRKDR